MAGWDGIMAFNGEPFTFGIGFNFLQDSTFTNVANNGFPITPIPPISGSFELLIEENFLLLGSEDFLLL